MTEPPVGLLARPLEEASRLLALGYLDAARASRARLDDPADGEALHDFRVALRRLRSALRSFRGVLGDTVPPQLARRLRKLAAATNATRDAEVQLHWLAGIAAVGAERRAARWLEAKLRPIEEVERRRARSMVERRHAALDRALRRRLQSLRIDLDLGVSGGQRPQLADWLGGQLRELAEELAERLRAVASLGDEEPAHRARIAAKRLRYLLEPLRESVPAVRALVAELRALQDLLGELHDGQVLIASLAELAAAAAAERARRRIEVAAERGSGDAAVKAAGRGAPTGLLLLVDRSLAEQREQFAALERGWLHGRSAPFFGGLERLADSLDGSPAAEM